MQTPLGRFVGLVRYAAALECVNSVLPDVFEPKGIAESVNKWKTGSVDEIVINIVAGLECVLLNMI